MLVELLTHGRILLAGRAASKTEVLTEVARLLASGDRALSEEILRGLLDREEVMSTGIGHGIALPHARLSGLPDMRVALARYPHGVPFQSLDDKPVLLAFGIVGPPAEADRHVKLLARVARLVKQPGAVSEVLQAPDADGVIAVLRRFDPA